MNFASGNLLNSLYADGAVVHCKLYSSPVGIKAVQEIAAGQLHEQANYGIVVSNQRFTAAAVQMAATNSVLLLHHDDLRRIDQLLNGPVLIARANDRV